MNKFSEKIYALAKLIPKGNVATYKQLAELVGSPSAARAVGVCMRTNKYPEIIPCHRVVASNGELTGYAFGGVSSKKAILQNEGVQFVGERVNLTLSQWKPLDGELKSI